MLLRIRPVRNALSIAGMVLTTISAVLFLVVFLADLFGLETRHSTQNSQNSQNRTGFPAGSASPALIVVAARGYFAANSAGTAAIGRIRMSR